VPGHTRPGPLSFRDHERISFPETETSMPDTTVPLPNFNPRNRAYLRFFDLLPDLDVTVRLDADNGRPLTLTITDPRSGDAFTVTADSSLEMTDPHALLALDRFGDIVAHGLFCDDATAQANVAPLAEAQRLSSVHTIPLHHPSTAELPETLRQALDPALVPASSRGTPTPEVAHCCCSTVPTPPPNLSDRSPIRPRL
jgi:hypothetical protein